MKYLSLTLSASLLIVSNTVSATSVCHLSEMTRGKFLYRSWSASVSLIPFVSSSSKEPMSKASAALTSPRGGINGGVYFSRYTCCQSIPLKNGCAFNSSAPLPRQPSLLLISRCSKPSNSDCNSRENVSGIPTFCNWLKKLNRIFTCTVQYTFSFSRNLYKIASNLPITHHIHIKLSEAKNYIFFYVVHLKIN